MAYRISQRDGTAAKAVRRIAREQVDAARAAVAHDRPLGPRVHAMRKSVKKLRGLIRLVRPGFDDFASENAALRDAARLLAPLREASVARQTLDALLPGTGLSRADADALRAVLDPGGPAADPVGPLAEFDARMAALRKRLRGWSVRGAGFSAFEGGLDRTLRSVRKDLDAALTGAEAEALHDWRKRVKDHWYQARILAPIWPEAMAAHAAAADRLGEALGDHHDLEDLVARLSARAPGPGGTNPAEPVIAAARTRQAALLAEASALGRRLFTERPACLTGRWRGWWAVWQSERGG